MWSLDCPSIEYKQSWEYFCIFIYFYKLDVLCWNKQASDSSSLRVTVPTTATLRAQLWLVSLVSADRVLCSDWSECPADCKSPSELCSDWLVARVECGASGSARVTLTQTISTLIHSSGHRQKRGKEKMAGNWRRARVLITTTRCWRRRTGSRSASAPPARPNGTSTRDSEWR